MNKYKTKATAEIFSIFPQANFAVVKISALKIHQPDQAENISSQMLDNALEDQLRIGKTLLKNKKVTLWQEKFKELNLDKQIMASHIGLLKRALKKNELFRVNPLVDCANALSLKHLLPIGLHDISGHSEINIGLTKGNETFTPMHSSTKDSESVTAGEPAYLDTNNQILTRFLTYRQADQTKITPATTDMVIFLDNVFNLFDRNQLQEIIAQLLGGWKEFADFKAEVSIIDKYNPLTSFTPLATEDLPLPYISKSRVQVNTDPEAIEKIFDHKLDQIYPSADVFRKALSSGKRLKFYIGADATGPNLHLGHLIPVLKMRQLQELGHEIIFLIGDFTARLGDPSDKSEVRKILSEKEVNENASKFKAQIAKYIDFHREENPAQLLFNSDWNDRLNLKDVINLAGHTTVQQMLERDMFAKRLEDNKPIYLHEFLYPLIQGYDSVVMEVDGEFGGRDQTFNMLMGRNLEKAYLNKDKFVLTFHFLLSADGKNKMSKSIGNCIFINDTPQDKFAKVMAIPDDLMMHYYEFATFISKQELIKRKEEIERSSDPLEAKKKLAYEIVSFHDGEESAQEALRYFEQTIQDNQAPEDAINLPLDKFSDNYTLKELLAAISIYRQQEIKTVKSLKPKTKKQLQLIDSNAKIKQLINSGAVEISGKQVTDMHKSVKIDDGTVVKIGKKYWLVFTK